MAIRPYLFGIDEYYHVYNRGTEKRAIFLDRFDKARFLRLLYLCNNTDSILARDILDDRPFETKRGAQLTDIGAYCLMGNHFHLLLREKTHNGITRFMQKLSTAYVMYFNKKRKRTGSLFEGKFKARHSQDDDYLKYLFAYIHLNPIAHIDQSWQGKSIEKNTRSETYLENYAFSSYFDYTGAKRAEAAILNMSAFPDYFSVKNTFQSFIKNWIAFRAYHEDVFGEESEPIEF